jgi:hypothetical protein
MNVRTCSTWVLGMVGTLAVLPAQADDAPRDSAGLAADPAALVRQLGDERFALRESATMQLIQLGLPARKALEAGRTHADREIRYRAERILSIIDEQEFQRRLAVFAAGRTDGSNELPGWKQFKTACGDDGPARSLFVEMQRAEPGLMGAIDDGAQAVGRAVEVRCLHLQQTQRSSGQAIGLGSIAALLFVVGDESLNLNFQTVSALCSFCYQPAVAAAMDEAGQRKILRKLLGAWIKRSDGWTGYQCLSLAMRYELKEGLAPAMKIVQNAGDQPYIRQNAVLTIAKLGDESQLPLLEKLLEDKSKCATQRLNNVTFETQLRDVALAAILIMKKQEPKEFGFERLQLNPTNVFVTSTVGFENEDKRKAAFAKYAKFRAAEQAPPSPPRNSDP